MRRFASYYFILVLVFWVPESLGEVSDRAAELTLGYSDTEAPPYQIRHDAPLPGIAFELIQRAADELNLKLRFAPLPNRRVLEKMKEGQIDGAFMYSFKPERQESGVYPWANGAPDSPRRITTLSYSLYKRPETQLSWDGKSLTGTHLIVGANSGYSVAGDLSKMGIKVQEVKTTEQNFEMLFLGRLSAVAHQDLVADSYLASVSKRTSFVKLTPPLSTKDYFLMLSHSFVQRYPAQSEEIWNKIGEIRDALTLEVLPKYAR